MDMITNEHINHEDDLMYENDQMLILNDEFDDDEALDGKSLYSKKNGKWLEDEVSFKIF